MSVIERAVVFGMQAQLFCRPWLGGLLPERNDSNR
jgi:hypothetical protein